MRVFQNRPFCLAVTVSVLVALFAIGVSRTVRLALLIALCAGFFLFLLIAFLKKSCGPRLSVCLLSLVCAGILVGSVSLHFDGAVAPMQARVGETFSLEGTVTDRISGSDYRSTFTVTTSEIDGKRLRQTVRLECAYFSALQPGERIRTTVTVRDWEENETSLLSDGVMGVVVCESSEDCLVVGKSDSLLLRLKRQNRMLSALLADRIGGEEGNLAAALLLGNRRMLSSDTVLAFRRTGVSHLLAISGLHLGILIGILEWFLRRFHLPRFLRAAVLIPLAVCYLALTGFALSTVRSVLMLGIAYLAFFLASSYDPLTAVCTALFGIVLATPYALLDVGLWMSFCATASIVIFLPAVERLFRNLPKSRWLYRVSVKFLRLLVLAFGVGVASFCAVLPITAWTYGETSVFAVPATFLLTPIVALALVLSILALLFPLPLFATLAGKTIRLILNFTRAASDRRGCMVLLRALPAKILLVLLVTLFLAFAVFGCRRKWKLLLLPLTACAILFAGALSVPSAKDDLCVTVLSDLGRETFLFTHAGRAVAVDSSSGASGYGYDLANAARDNSCTELDELVLTHYHAAASRLIASVSSNIKLRAVCLPEPQNDAEVAIAERLAEEAKLHGVEVRYGTGTLSIPGLALSVSHATGNDGGEAGVVMTADFRNSRFAYLSPVWQQKLQWVPYIDALTTCRMLVIGYHGLYDPITWNLPEQSTVRQVLILPPEELLTVSGLPWEATVTYTESPVKFRMN